jgi:bifunctional UDP-N-acetylglucosamine pyrophosphorylase / glucosamine-1-phosphate N-acetyltransferase
MNTPMVTASAMVLAAGEGTRMRSRRPKPLHLLCGRAMLLYALDALDGLGEVDRCVVVVGHGAEQVTKKLTDQASHLPLSFVEQMVQRGTGDAVAVGLTAFSDTELDDDEAVLIVMPGDTPLVRTSTIADLVSAHLAAAAGATVLTARLADPTGYGRVIRGRSGEVLRIVEHRDATGEERAVDEINTSIYCFRRSLVGPALRRVRPDNAQGEYYLTDIIGVLAEAGYRIAAHVIADAEEAAGVNDRHQLGQAEAELRRRVNERWQAEGVTLVDPASVYIDSTVQLAADVTIFPNTLLQGRTVVGEGAELGPDTRLVDCVVERDARVERTTGHDAEVGTGAVVGPFAVLEPGSVVPPGGRVAPFTSHGPET